MSNFTKAGTRTDTATGLGNAVRRPPSGAVRQHHVTAVLVTHDGQRWLPRVRKALAATSRRPDRLVAVDTGSVDGTPDLLAGGWVDDVVTVDRRTGFGTAVAAALAEPVIDLRGPAERPAEAPAETVEWLWLLHDDLAPAPDALQRLLAAADRDPGAAVLGPKLRGWRQRDVILECGVSLSGTGRRETGIVSGEVDQGQHDLRREVMAVSTAGMLVRRDVWDRVGGLAPAFPLLGDDADFCWRARKSGAKVVAVPGAVAYHRQATADHLRPPDAVGGRLRRANRKVAVTTALIHAPWWRVPFTVGRCLVGAILRFVFHLAMLSPGRAWDDLAGTLAGLVSWRAVAAGRRAPLADGVTTAELRRLRPSLGQRFIHWQESMVRHQRSQTDREAALTHRWGVGVRLAALVGGVLVVVCGVATWELWFGAGRLAGGALLPAPDSAVDLVRFFAAPWHDVGLGSDVPAPPYVLLVAAVAAPLLGSAAAATQVLVLLGPVLAGLAALVALRGLVGRGTAVVAAVVYALLPATIAAVGTGRIGTTIAAILLPGVLRLLTRLSGITSPLPPARRLTVLGAGLATAALGAAVPALAVTAIALAAIAALVTRHGRGLARVGFVAAGVVALLWPWSGYVLTHPALLLVDVGAHPAGLADQAAPVWALAVLDPGGAAAPPAGLAAALVVLAVLALLPSRTRRAVVTAWLLVLAGLLLGIGQALVTVVLPSAQSASHPWPGPATLLAGAGAVVAVAVAASGVPRTGKSKVLARAFLVACLVAPVLLGGWWMAQGRTLLERREPGVVSSFVSDAALGPAAPRALVLRGNADRSVTYELLAGAGPRLGDADVAPAAATMAGIDRAIADLLAGGSASALATLQQASVQFVAVDTREYGPLARQLDAVSGLRRLSTLEGQGLWELAGWQPRARALTPAGPVEVPADASGPSLNVSGSLPAGATALELAESPAALWQARAGDTQLTPADGPWQQFEVASGVGTEVTAAPAPGSRLTALLVPLAAIVLLALPALARRRRRRPPAGQSGPEPAEPGRELATVLEGMR